MSVSDFILFAFAPSSQNPNVLTLVLSSAAYVLRARRSVIKRSAPCALRDVGLMMNPRRESSAATK